MIEDASNRYYAHIILNHNILGKSDLSKFYEWVKIVVVKYEVADELALLVKLRYDISSYSPLLVGKVAAIRFNSLVIPTLLEYIYLIQFTMFTPIDRLFTPTCNLFAFEPIRE